MTASLRTTSANPPGNDLPPLNPQQKESLLMLIVVHLAEEHGLLNTEQLEDARASLRALFLRATGEETMLRKIIGILRINRSLNKTFSEMAQVLEGIYKSNHTLIGKHTALQQQLTELGIAPEENERFTKPLLEYSADIVRTVGEFNRQMVEYKNLKEAEARSAHIFRLAQEARERLKQRFEQGVVHESHAEQQVKQKVFQSFNYAEAESDFQYNRRSAKSARDEIEDILANFRQICQLAMKPEMRSQIAVASTVGKKPGPDIYAITLKAMDSFPRLRVLLPVVQELLRVYQRSYGMFQMDFDKFNRALAPMAENTEDYFHAKEQDEDVRTKQKKLAMIEALIAFIEDAAQLLKDGHDYTYPKYSIAVSSRISHAGSKWSMIAEPLLQMKVIAEAELTTRLD